MWIPSAGQILHATLCGCVQTLNFKSITCFPLGWGSSVFRIAIDGAMEDGKLP